MAAALVAILLLAFVLPWMVATQVNARRVAQAQDDVRRIAQDVNIADRAVLAGNGAAPKFAEGVLWPDVKAGILHAAPDPWGNQYLVISTGPAGPVTVLSAGPNGIVETPFNDAGRPSGDDIGYQVRR